MKILFNEVDASGGELHDILGFTDASISIGKVWSYLRTASREIYEIIGKTNYEICEAVRDAELAPEDESLQTIATEENKELYTLVRYAIALNAFRKYQPLNDIAFTTDGRLFRRDEHQVAAFEWQINNSDDAMERAYYEAVDDIISFILDSDLLEPSDYMTQFTGLYVPDLATFQRFVNINNSHLLYYKLAPSLRLCEQREIINRLGSRFLEYKLPERKDDYITNLIQNCCVYFAMADGIQKFSVQLFPEGLMKTEKTNRKSASGYDKESTTLFYRQQLEGLFKNLEIEIKKLEPEYTSPPRINFCADDGFVSF